MHSPGPTKLLYNSPHHLLVGPSPPFVTVSYGGGRVSPGPNSHSTALRIRSLALRKVPEGYYSRQ